MCGECEQTLGETSATNNVCGGGYMPLTVLTKIFAMKLTKRLCMQSVIVMQTLLIEARKSNISVS
jgi:hypothetical protein